MSDAATIGGAASADHAALTRSLRRRRSDHRRLSMTMSASWFMRAHILPTFVCGYR
jgi:hypothetical protein